MRLAMPLAYLGEKKDRLLTRCARVYSLQSTVYGWTRCARSDARPSVPTITYSLLLTPYSLFLKECAIVAEGE